MILYTYIWVILLYRNRGYGNRPDVYEIMECVIKLGKYYIIHNGYT